MVFCFVNNYFLCFSNKDEIVFFIKSFILVLDCLCYGIRYILYSFWWELLVFWLNKMEFYMKVFNKLFFFVVVFVLVFFFVGCGDKEELKKFSVNLNGIEIVIIYVYKGDKVFK